MYNTIFYEKDKLIEITENYILTEYAEDGTASEQEVTRTIERTYKVPSKFVFDTATNCDKMFKGFDVLDNVTIDAPSLNSAVAMFESSTIQTFSGVDGVPANFISLTSADNMFAYCEQLVSINIDACSLTNVSDFVTGSALESFSGNLSSLVSAENMFENMISLTTFDAPLDSLNNGEGMFKGSGIVEFSSNLESLRNGTNMFAESSIPSFNNDMPELINGVSMFESSQLNTFSGALNLLENGEKMFKSTSIETFENDMPNLINGTEMFYGTNLKSFKANLAHLVNGENMFSETSLKEFEPGSLDRLEKANNMMGTPAIIEWNIDMPALTEATQMFVAKVDEESTIYPSLQTFISDLSSLVDGTEMFKDCTSLTSFNAPLSSLDDAIDMFTNCKLDAQSLLYIVETLPQKEEGIGRIITIGINATSEENDDFIKETGLYNSYEELYDALVSKGWYLELKYNK